MKHVCLDCGNTYELIPEGFHFFPFCVHSKMKFPYGITDKHTLSGAISHGFGTSYLSDQVNGENIFKYLTQNKHTNPTGAEFVRSTKHGSINVICHRPLGEIPGSGICYAGHRPAEFAVLYDIEGKSHTGHHFAFYTQKQIDTQFAVDWKALPMCNKCKAITVRALGDVCENCKLLP